MKNDVPNAGRGRKLPMLRPTRFNPTIPLGAGPLAP
jgi:hypothetical protein